MPWAILPQLTGSSSSVEEPKPSPPETVEEREYRFPAYLPRVWQEIDITARKDRFHPTDSFTTREAGGKDSFRLQVYVNPKESNWFCIRVDVLPPEYMKQQPQAYWIVEDVFYEITLFNFQPKECPAKCIHLVNTETFQLYDDPHYVNISRASEITQEKGFLDAKGNFRIRFRALLPVDDDKLIQTAKALDLSQDLVTVTFRLPEGECLYVDKRVLVARSEYFRNMLATDTYKEGQTNEIDLTTDPQADKKTLTAVLVYIMSGSFTADGDTEFSFAVRKLADRFLLEGLCDLVDAELESLLRPENVLDFFSEVAGSQGRLEQACAGLVTEDNCELLEVQKEKVCKIVKRNPAMAEIIFQVLLHYKKEKVTHEGPPYRPRS